MKETSYKSESKTDSKITLSPTSKKECKASDIEKNWNKDLERRGVFGPKELSWEDIKKDIYQACISAEYAADIVRSVEKLLETAGEDMCNIRVKGLVEKVEKQFRNSPDCISYYIFKKDWEKLKKLTN